MKTLIMFDDLISEIRFVIVDGDYSRFNGICINGSKEHDFEEEFINFFFNQGDFKYELSHDISLVENKQWDKVAITTFIP